MKIRIATLTVVFSCVIVLLFAFSISRSEQGDKSNIIMIRLRTFFGPILTNKSGSSPSIIVYQDGEELEEIPIKGFSIKDDLSNYQIFYNTIISYEKMGYKTVTSSESTMGQTAWSHTIIMSK